MNIRTWGVKGIETLPQDLHPCDMAGGTCWSMLPLNWLQTNGRMENGEQEKMSTQESRVLAPELDPTPSRKTKAGLQTNRVCAVGMSVVCIHRAAAAQVWGFAHLGL